MAVAVLAAVTGVMAATPHLDRPFARLAKYDGTNGDPIYNVPLDAAAVRRAASIVPAGSLYWVGAPAGSANAQLAHDLTGALRLFLLPSLPVAHARDASWAITYGPVRLPIGMTATQILPLGGRLTAFRLRKG